MADMFADRQLKKAIGNIIFHKEDLLKDYKLLFPQDVKNAIRNYGLPFVLETIENAVVELADDNWFKNKYPKEIFKESKIKPIKRKSVIKLNLKKSILKKAINDNLKIIEVAESYGIKVKNRIALCPFHEDKNPSLSFSNEKNVFNCFGCGVKGNLIDFIRRCEIEKEDGNNTTSRTKSN